MKIIGLVGPKQAGKTTVFDLLSSMTATNEVMLAGHLKDVCSAVFKINRSYFDLQSMKEEPLDKPVIITERLLNDLIDSYQYPLGMRRSQFNDCFKQVGRLMRTPREIAQIIGTDVLRAADPAIHLKMAELRFDPSKTNVVTDVRFPNELKWVTSLKGETWYIYRPEADLAAEAATHVSEKGVPTMKGQCTRIVKNVSTIEYLTDQIRGGVL